MRRVTPEEAKICREKLEEWAKSDTPSSGGKIGQWIYKERMPALDNNIDKWGKFGKTKRKMHYQINFLMLIIKKMMKGILIT